MSELSEALNAANTNSWSAREISRRTDGRLSHSLVADYMAGRQAKNPKDYVLQALADVFPTLTVSQLRELAGKPSGEEEPYEPPDVASRLNTRQRQAVDEIIRLLVDREQGNEHENVGVERTAQDVLEAQRSKRQEMQRMPKQAARKPRK